MKKAYSMLSSGDCSNWGQCMLVDQTIGEVIKGERKVEGLSKDIIFFLGKEYLHATEEDLKEITDEDIKHVEDNLYNKNSYKDYAYHFLANSVYHNNVSYIVEFKDIAQMANYVRENNIEIIENLLR